LYVVVIGRNRFLAKRTGLRASKQRREKFAEEKCIRGWFRGAVRRGSESRDHQPTVRVVGIGSRQVFLQVAHAVAIGVRVGVNAELADEN
jgi:hypothetical protein